MEMKLVFLLGFYSYLSSFDHLELIDLYHVVVVSVLLVLVDKKTSMSQILTHVKMMDSLKHQMLLPYYRYFNKEYLSRKKKETPRPSYEYTSFHILLERDIYRAKCYFSPILFYVTNINQKP